MEIYFLLQNYVNTINTRRKHFYLKKFHTGRTIKIKKKI